MKGEGEAQLKKAESKTSAMYLEAGREGWARGARNKKTLRPASESSAASADREEYKRKS